MTDINELTNIDTPECQISRVEVLLLYGNQPVCSSLNYKIFTGDIIILELVLKRCPISHTQYFEDIGHPISYAAPCFTNILLSVVLQQYIGGACGLFPL